ncbi:MAG: DUF4869 domain-containing protein [Lachnospiraceae bacterium]|nr:DUF4869 domain-containing protein [Lachnospiraceae bacterium]
MLKIVMGSEFAQTFIPDRKFIEFPNSYFNELKESKWFKDPFVQEVIKVIDKAYVESGFAVHSIGYDEGYSVNDLAGGSKFLILLHMLRNNVYLATMGDNCTDFVERLALEYEKEGKDLILVANYLHKFNFTHIDSIEYMNWGITCHSWSDIHSKVWHKWIEQEHRDRDPEDEEDDFSNLEGSQQEAIINKVMKGEL